MEWKFKKEMRTENSDCRGRGERGRGRTGSPLINLNFCDVTCGIVFNKQTLSENISFGLTFTSYIAHKDMRGFLVLAALSAALGSSFGQSMLKTDPKIVCYMDSRGFVRQGKSPRFYYHFLFTRIFPPKNFPEVGLITACAVQKFTSRLFLHLNFIFAWKKNFFFFNQRKN